MIHFLGIGLSGVFAKIAFSIAMAGLLDFVRNITYVLFTDVLPGLSRMVEVEIKDSTSIYFDGVRVGANWVTAEIATYLSENHASIEEVAEGDGEADDTESIEDAIKQLKEDQKNHLLQDKHNWNKLTPDPKDPNNWNVIAALMSKVLSEGSERFYKYTSGGESVYIKALEIKGEITEVTYMIIDGILKIGDAWVK